MSYRLQLQQLEDHEGFGVRDFRRSRGLLHRPSVRREVRRGQRGEVAIIKSLRFSFTFVFWVCDLPLHSFCFFVVRLSVLFFV